MKNKSTVKRAKETIDLEEFIEIRITKNYLDNAGEMQAEKWTIKLKRKIPPN